MSGHVEIKKTNKMLKVRVVSYKENKKVIENELCKCRKKCKCFMINVKRNLLFFSKIKKVNSKGKLE